jgi:hypothetical protein
MLSFFRQVLGSEINRLRIAGAKLEAEARAEQTVQTARLEKRLNSVEQGGNGRSARSGRMSMDEIMREAFKKGD